MGLNVNAFYKRVQVQSTMVPKDMLREWALATFSAPTDYWTFRKMLTLQLSLAGFAEYVLHLTRLNPDMMYVHQDSGLLNVSYFKFDVDDATGMLCSFISYWFLFVCFNICLECSAFYFSLVFTSKGRKLVFVFIFVHNNFQKYCFFFLLKKQSLVQTSTIAAGPALLTLALLTRNYSIFIFLLINVTCFNIY